ncbi:uncharacterized protein LOC127770721 [Oryza glaberrima]|uniref:uncharacterized protein LOC127770721 n=1 Tax=Oryza glaberrima TaxID=4538 RepID=UPI00224C4044|nr:uncharacterized protein LOC127770721 [Oryza glaberrima]
MASLTTTTAAASSPAALPAASTTAPASSVSPAAAAAKRPHLAGDDAPWRATATGAAGIRPVPRIHHAPVLRVAQDDYSAYALAVMKHPDPIGEGLAMEAMVEAAGPECIVPGQQAPLRLLGLKVWPLDIEMKFLEPFGRELHSMKKFMDKSCSVMDSSMSNK